MISLLTAALVVVFVWVSMGELGFFTKRIIVGYGSNASDGQSYLLKRKMRILGKLVVGLLFSHKAQREHALEEFSTERHTVQRQSPCYAFEETDYYDKEMSPPLWRQFVSFSDVIALEEVVSWKKRSEAVEDRFRQENRRQVNLDPGYLDLHKVVLLSAKSGGHKIYLGRQVWADMVLMKNKGSYENFAWTFPDLRTHKYDEWFLQVRSDFKKDLLSR